MVAALVAYTTGVWAERLSGQLRAWHVLAFWIGVTADTWGTHRMFGLAQHSILTFHGLTGVLALGLMAAHVLWASVVSLRAEPDALARFHRVSTIVWAFWLVPFFAGAWLAVSGRLSAA
ncbi:MAG: HsmA family protein [Hyphomicrobiales bacterium]